ncbi:MAG TPA: hypothetical protein VFE78_18340 [Gemmataceae bacterium]|jgi:hypothetical protein|nr:hypothetical protein [Gemmataceae bacterium]
MPLLDHFHPPLHGPRRPEGFYHAWATFVAQQLNQQTLPPGYFAEPEIRVDFAHLDSCEVRVYQDLGGAELRAAIELVSPANKDREGNRRTFAARCAGHLKHGLGLMIVDVVTACSADLNADLFDALEVNGRQTAWASPTGLYAVAYRAVTGPEAPRVEVWPEALVLGAALPVLPLWLALDLCVPVRLEESYLATCRSLRIPA